MTGVTLRSVEAAAECVGVCKCIPCISSWISNEHFITWAAIPLGRKQRQTRERERDSQAGRGSESESECEWWKWKVKIKNVGNARRKKNQNVLEVLFQTCAKVYLDWLWERENAFIKENSFAYFRNKMQSMVNPTGLKKVCTCFRSRQFSTTLKKN